MPITLKAPSTVIDGARSYAEQMGMTLESLVIAYLESVANRKRSADASGCPSPIANPLAFQHSMQGGLNRESPRVEKVPLFGSLKNEIKFIAADFDEPVEDFAEYM